VFLIFGGLLSDGEKRTARPRRSLGVSTDGDGGIGQSTAGGRCAWHRVRSTYFRLRVAWLGSVRGRGSRREAALLSHEVREWQFWASEALPISPLLAMISRGNVEHGLLF
jgi:hypothetical protein